MKTCLFAGLMLSVMAGCGQSAFAEVSIEGPWDTSEGPMTIERLAGNAVRAAYGADQGRIVGQLEDSKLSGQWIERFSDRRCASEVDGSAYWGWVQFDFTVDGSSFEGRWGYCENASPVLPWSGRRPADYIAKKPARMPGMTWMFVLAGLCAIILFLWIKTRKKTKRSH